MEDQITALTTRVQLAEAQITADKAIINSLSSASGNRNEVDTFYILWAGTLIFLMQAGFATLSAGSIRSKNVRYILHQSCPPIVP